MGLYQAWIKDHAGNLIIFFLSVLTLFNPVAHTTTVREICFYIPLLLFILLLLTNRKGMFFFRTPLFIPTVLFSAWAVFGLFFALDKSNSWHDIYSLLFRYSILAVLIVSFFWNEKKMRLLSWLITISLVSFVSYALIKFYFVTDFDFGVRFYGNSEGMTQNLINIPIIFSCFLIYCNLVDTNKLYLRLLYLLLYIPLISALILTQSRSSWAALIISGLFFSFLCREKKIVILLVILAVIASFSPLKGRFLNGDLTKDPRLTHALLVLEVVKDHPFIGIGFGMETFGKSLDLGIYLQRMERVYGVKYHHVEILSDPHNLFTDVLVRTGFVGFGLFLWFFFCLFRMLWEVGRGENIARQIWAIGIASSLISFLIIGFFEPVFSHVQVYYLTLMISFVSILWKQHGFEKDYFDMVGEYSRI